MIKNLPSSYLAAATALLSCLNTLVNARPTPPASDPPSTGEVSSAWTRQSLIGLGPRQEHSAAVIDDTIYIAGGIAYDDVYIIGTTARVEAFNTTTEQWSVPGPLPRPINHVNLASVNGKLYSFGGLAGESPEDPIWLAIADSYMYDPFIDVWAPISPLPNGTAQGSSAVGVQGSIVYLAGGMTRLEATADGTQDAVTIVTSYDTATDTWSEDLPPLPGPRQHVGGVVVNNVFYVLGGRVNSPDDHRDTVFALDLTNPTEWTERAPMPTSRGGLACSSLYERYIVCAGGEGNTDNELGIFDETEMYDTETDSWVTLEPMAVPRHGTVAVTAGEKMYIPGGGIAMGGLGGTNGVFDYLTVEV